jgi:hypothetical protein
MDSDTAVFEADAAAGQIIHQMILDCQRMQFATIPLVDGAHHAIRTISITSGMERLLQAFVDKTFPEQAGESIRNGRIYDNMIVTWNAERFALGPIESLPSRLISSPMSSSSPSRSACGTG